MRRWIAGGAVLVLAVAAIILAVMGSLSATSRRDTSLDAGTPAVGSRSHSGTTPARDAARTSAATTPTSPMLTAAGARSSASPAVAKLRAAMTRTLAPAGPNVGALVYDLDDHAELFGAHASVGRPPASVEKLWTTTTLIDKLGADARLHTALLGTGTQRGGVWHGDLYLRGGGDPTFGDAEFNRVWNQGHGPTAAQLVAQLRRRGIRRVTGTVYADESLFDRRRGGLSTHYRPDVPDFGGQLGALTYDHGTTARRYGPGTFAAHELVLTMRGSKIAARASMRTRSTPRSADLLATVDSPPMSVMMRLMDVPSDDLFAELFAKQLGVLFGRGGTISAGARVISDTIADAYDLHPRILDGSGLSRGDRTSPLQIVELLRDLWRTHVGRELSGALPTVGVDGTVRGIAARTTAQGRCIAKTGTLDGVTNLAGYCAAKGRHAIAFGLFVDGPDNAEAFSLEGRMLAAIARY